MGNTLGIHWIVTTHGSWLHGDPRGSWRHGKLIGPDPFLEEAIRQRMSHDAIVLNHVEQLLVAATWGVAIDQWKLHAYAATLHATHGHVIFAPMRPDVDEIIAGLKRRSAEQVLTMRRSMFGDAGEHLWTARPFPLFIFDDQHLANAVEYVRSHNRRIGRPADPYAWIRPLHPP